MIETSANSRAVFDRYGLRATGRLWGGAVLPDDESTSEGVGKRLRDALEQLGGLYAAFGRFLGWRSDLLDAACIGHLRHLKVNLPVVPVSVVRGIIRRELPEAAAGELADNLEASPVWNTLARTAYVSRYRDQRVIVQVARDPVSEESFGAFEKGLRSLSRPEVAGMVTPAVLSQFREWIRHGESLTRERSLLAALGKYAGETLVEYPRLISGLTTSSILCWPDVTGRPVSELIALGDQQAPVLIASAILEQFYSLSIVVADLDLDAMFVGPNNRLHFRRLNSAISVLPNRVNTGIQYATAVVAGDAAVSAQKLIGLTLSRPSPDMERQLLDEFSGIEPELKVNLWFPPSVEAFENNWRALARIFPSRPLFLDCLHRNLIAAGYWNSDAVRAGAQRFDAISEAQWPVVGALIRGQFGMLMNRQAAEEWAIGSGLLMFGALREMNRLVEEMRENDIRVGIDFDETPRQEDHAPQTSYGLLLGALVVVFLAGLRWGSAVPEPWSALLKILAAGALPAMFWAISRIR
jgi:hypothetical protein